MAEPTKRATKYDPNTEAFQMRAQWKKTDICRKSWLERWAWLLDELAIAHEESKKVRGQHAGIVSLPKAQVRATSSLKPVPLTTTGFVGWLASKPECQLEIYSSWLSKPPLRIPDAWEYKGYVEVNQPR